MTAATYGDMETRIADEIDRTDIAVSYIPNAILDAIKYFESDHFDFNEEVRDFTLVQGDARLSLPSDFMTIVSISIVYNDVYYPLTSRNYTELEQIDHKTQARPVVYCQFASALRLYPYPDQAYQGNMSYIKQFTTLSATTDTNVWTTIAEPMIREKAKAYIYRNRLKDFDRAAIHEQFAQDEYRNLKQKAAYNQTSGRLVVEYP